MDKMDSYEKALSYHAKGASALTEAKEDKKPKESPPFDGPYLKKKVATPGKHGYGASAAKHLAKQGMKKQMTKEETIEALEALESVYEEAIMIQAALEESGIDIDEIFALAEKSEDVDEGFGQMSKTKQLIARRKAGMRKKLTVGYKIKRK